MENLSLKKEQMRRLRIRNSIILNVTTYILVIGFLTVMNYFTSPGYWWVIWPALGWGLGLAINTVSRLLTINTPDYGDGE